MTPLRIGIIPLTDCAPIAVACERGFFRRHGIDARVTREASWASLRDKLAAGALDAAHMLAPMPIAATLGIDPLAVPTITAFSLGLNGNAITLSEELWSRMRAADGDATAARPLPATALRRVIEDDRRRGRPPLRFAVVYPFSSHDYELRYWLAAAGIDPEADVGLAVVPPPRMVECLESRTIDGFCVGEPWSSLAVRRGVGRIAITKLEIWSNSPEKVLAVRRDWADRHRELHRAALRALLEAAVWTDRAENRAEVAHVLASERWVGAPASLLAGSLTGRIALAQDGEAVELPDFHVFHRYAATFPWVSHAAWLVLQMLRWGQLARPVDVLDAAASVYRPDLYREAARDVGVSAPAADVKTEGTHAGPWSLAGADGATIAMGPDLFFDGGTFDPRALVASLTRSPIASPRVDLGALAALNA
ncbi:MAG TPA: CmpA/NrtA family ABC transporter substrate-binding protein [Candidatus Binatia bacterium]|nr:CmpA/NrtA family ABC transporter substrate-binding protein [Candidatus Binatia bacterium]